ncbi:thiamine transporter 1-like [Macrosteles quadrilineatus]|uniref:thiamine transporter 1-like n=1 Tax=Macrosteles quadrilineatus TaxID=74068 RepID=UPI0023E0D184|nr:thiamine transporter 1-like [Macrosteles quadrilineatus]
MDEWVKLTIFLCVYGFMKEIGPDDPFILHHLDNREQNEARIWEVLTQLILTTMLFFCADYFRYKPFIVIGALFGLAAQIINLVSEDTFALMGRQCLYGAAKAAEVAYFSYIYAKVPKINYTKVTSFCQAAAVAGGIFSALVSLWPLPGLWSNYVTIIVLAFAVCWLVLLPNAETTLYFHRARIVSLGGQAENIQAGPAPKPSITVVQQLLWEDFKAAYYNPYTLGFCVYVVMMTAAFSQMVICVQLLGVFLHGSPVATANSEIASRINPDSYGLVISLNNTLSLFLHSVLYSCGYALATIAHCPRSSRRLLLV